MTISSRTPEGLPHLCPVCGNVANLDPSFPGGDACCPSCGQLLWWFRDHLSLVKGVAPESITLSSPLIDDSLDIVELIMELEEQFDVVIPDDAAERIRTIGDTIRYIQESRRIDPA